MSQLVSESRPRILIVDDNPAIHEDFQKILGSKSEAQAKLEDVEAALFGDGLDLADRAGFRIESAHQGQEALELVRKALEQGDPYVMAFVDVRMPPGWDGIETLERIWQCSPDLQAVICTAYSDYSWDDMTRRLGHTDNLLILKKPFETVEVLQLAHALTHKWTLARQARLRMEDLDRMVRQRTEELTAANQNLHQEIEERVRIQDELRVSEERFSKAFRSSPFPIAIQHSADRYFVDANQSFLELSGYTAEHLAGHTDQSIQLWSKGGESGSAPFMPEGRLRNQSCLLRRSDGTARQILLFTEPISLGDTPCLLLVVEDITDQLRLEAQLRQAQKMEVIGRMAAGIAHEFNNILTVIQGDVGLLQSPSASTMDRGALLDQIMQASKRAAAFTRQLLAFSRKQVLQPRLISLSAVVQRTKKMLGRLIGEKFEIQLHCPNEVPSVLADEGGVEQILINLALNARDAMPDGGIIEIKTGVCVLDEAAANANPEARPGRFVCLAVTDHGCGMNPQVLGRIFDPFFTTKDVGKGTGLGLSTIHGIVKQHEGWIDVLSEVGCGSTFRIFLPACNAAPAAAPTAQGENTPAEPGRGETVLVVEDENAVRELACASLQRRGYQVLKAANGPQAVEVWERHASQVSLLLTDMVMPSGMNGSELAHILQSRNPRLKVIYTSGYSPEILKKDSLLTQGINFLPKPYDPQTLLKAVRACLDGTKPAHGEIRAAKPESAPVR
jgi:two-component system, cell cycle sensor histidine kinase and response regulator CckA